VSRTLPIRLAHELAQRAPTERWLIEGLWSERAVGIVGGQPKCCKSWLALDVAVSVASGTPCLRRYATSRPGPVLLYAAEDALHVVRERLEGICAVAGVSLEGLPLHVITAPVLRLDQGPDRDALAQAVAELRPRLLVLDPFVRLHRVDENQAGEVAPLLANLRELERRYATSVLLVHHARKGGHARAGQALRGSSELHAWGDSNLYLRRKGTELTLTVEHRAAPAPPSLALELRESGQGISLVVADEGRPPAAAAPRPAARQRVLDALGDAGQPLAVRELRERCRIRTTTLCDLLRQLVAEGEVIQSAVGYAPAR
jgi:hypothetical protein